MFQPTRRAVILVAMGAPLSLLIGVVEPRLWLSGLVWIVITIAFVIIDGALAASCGAPSLTGSAPAALSVNVRGTARVEVVFARRAPKRIDATLDLDDRLKAVSAQIGEVRDRRAEVAFDLTPIRRGIARSPGVWVRWAGPMGLVRKQTTQMLDLAIAITPDIEAVKCEAIRLFSRQGLLGAKTQFDLGEGAEFHALLEFQPGMDTRRIDWKQSARHHQLFAREYRAERNHPVVMALDCGRSMSEPVRGVPRLDWALSAALLLAYVSLRMGDRAGLYAFDSKPRAMIGTVTGVRAFPALERMASEIDYSTEESNYTLGLFTLLVQLKRRSLVIVFTEFADATSAELMIEAVERLLTRHLVVFVVANDDELETLRDSEPRAPVDVSKAVIAANLLREREIVLTRLRRLGVEIVDAPVQGLREDLLNRYLDLKRHNRL
jgi:uncharacterized protein (DUF58 family)